MQYMEINDHQNQNDYFQRKKNEVIFTYFWQPMKKMFILHPSSRTATEDFPISKINVFRIQLLVISYIHVISNSYEITEPRNI